MDTQAIQAQHETLNAIVDACHACGLKLKPDAETVLLEKITAKGVSASAGAMGLELAQGSTQIVVSSALKSLYAENPDLFYYDPRIAPSDVVVCRADLNHGTQQEILQRKAKWQA